MEIKNIRIEHEKNRKGEPKRTHHKIYLFIENETLFENLMNRRNRPYNTYRKEVLPVVLERVKETDPVTYNLIKDAKWGWDKNCGCSMCPCSPGFISDINGGYSNHRTIFVTI